MSANTAMTGLSDAQMAELPTAYNEGRMPRTLGLPQEEKVAEVVTKTTADDLGQSEGQSEGQYTDLSQKAQLAQFEREFDDVFDLPLSPQPQPDLLLSIPQQSSSFAQGLLLNNTPVSSDIITSDIAAATSVVPASAIATSVVPALIPVSAPVSKGTVVFQKPAAATASTPTFIDRSAPIINLQSLASMRPSSAIGAGDQDHAEQKSGRYTEPRKLTRWTAEAHIDMLALTWSWFNSLLGEKLDMTGKDFKESWITFLSTHSQNQSTTGAISQHFSSLSKKSYGTFDHPAFQKARARKSAAKKKKTKQNKKRASYEDDEDDGDDDDDESVSDYNTSSSRANLPPAKKNRAQPPVDYSMLSSSSYQQYSRQPSDNKNIGLYNYLASNNFPIQSPAMNTDYTPLSSSPLIGNMGSYGMNSDTTSIMYNNGGSVFNSSPPSIAGNTFRTPTPSLNATAICPPAPGAHVMNRSMSSPMYQQRQQVPSVGDNGASARAAASDAGKMGLLMRATAAVRRDREANASRALQQAQVSSYMLPGQVQNAAARANTNTNNNSNVYQIPQAQNFNFAPPVANSTVRMVSNQSYFPASATQGRAPPPVVATMGYKTQSGRAYELSMGTLSQPKPRTPSPNSETTKAHQIQAQLSMMQQQYNEQYQRQRAMTNNNNNNNGGNFITPPKASNKPYGTSLTQEIQQQLTPRSGNSHTLSSHTPPDEPLKANAFDSPEQQLAMFNQPYNTAAYDFSAEFDNLNDADISLSGISNFDDNGQVSNSNAQGISDNNEVNNSNNNAATAAVSGLDMSHSNNSNANVNANANANATSSADSLDKRSDSVHDSFDFGNANYGLDLDTNLFDSYFDQSMFGSNFPTDVENWA